MTFPTLPTRGPSDLQAAISDVRPPVTNELSADSVEAIKDRLIQIGGAVGIDGGSTGSTALREVVNELVDAADVAALTLRDDFHDPFLAGWLRETADGGEVKVLASATASGFPSSGCAVLECSTASGSEASITRAGTGLLFDTGQPIVLEFKYFLAPGDDDCTWSLGLIDTTGQEGVLWAGQLSGATRIFRVATVIADVPTLTNVGAPSAGTYHTVRMTVAPTGTTIEISTDGGAFATLGTASVAPTAAVYFPYVKISKGSGAGGRAIVVDFVDIAAERSAADSGAALTATTAPQAITAAEVPDAVEGTTIVPAVVGDAGFGSALSIYGQTVDIQADGDGAIRFLSTPSLEGDRILFVGEPISDTDAATKGYVDQPPANPEAAGYALAAADIGGIVFATGAGAQAFTLPDLSGSLIAGKTLILRIQQTGAATNVTITPGGSSQINGAGVGVAYVCGAGMKFTTLRSVDGLNWYAQTA
jgi:hypothetical protein